MSLQHLINNINSNNKRETVREQKEGRWQKRIANKFRLKDHNFFYENNFESYGKQAGLIITNCPASRCDYMLSIKMFTN